MWSEENTGVQIHVLQTLKNLVGKNLKEPLFTWGIFLYVGVIFLFIYFVLV